MSIGVVCCRVLEREVRAVIAGRPEITHLEVMDWGLHVQPDRLQGKLCEKIEDIQKCLGFLFAVSGP